jgi:hypothetical protein
VAAGALTDVLIIVDGTDLSECVRLVSHDMSCEERLTSVITDTWTTRDKGLVKTVIRLGFLQNYAAQKAHRVLQPLVDSHTPVQLELRPVNAVSAPDNPSLLVDVLLFDYRSLEGAVGEVAASSATFIGGDGIFVGGLSAGGGFFGDDIFGDGYFGGDA